MRTLVLGDIHGQYAALRCVLERSGYDDQYDKLIVLGDIVDGGPDSYKVVDYLSSLENTTLVLGNHDCVAEDTEILTNSGWCKIQNYNFNDTVAQYNINTKEISFDYPEEFVINTPQECICIEGYDTKQIVSERHDVIINWEKVKAKELISRDIKTTMIPNYGVTSNNEGIDLTDNEIRLFTWIIMDGSFCGKTRNNCKIKFRLAKERKITNICNLLDNMAIVYTKHICKKNVIGILQPYDITISRTISKILYDKLNGCKCIPNNWRYMSCHQIDVFLETLLMTDGYKSDGKIRWRTISENNVNIMQQAFLMNGYSSTIKSYVNSGRFANEKLMYECNIYITGRYRHKVNISSIGKIRTYGFKMPLGTIITRCDGKVAITGNCWFVNYIKTSVELPIWVNQGGYATLYSYERENRGKIPFAHAEFLHKGCYWLMDEYRNIYVHGGFNPTIPIGQQNVEDILWDRQIIEYAHTHNIDGYNHVYVGHTTTKYYKSSVPVTFNNLTMLDTGAGWPGGKLTIMDVNTREFWQSDVIKKW